jgi:hypothetical protein
MRVLSAFAITGCLAAPSSMLAADPQPECGVDMPHTTTSSSFDPAAIERDGIFQIDGGLFRNGLVARCIAVHIECLKETKQCQMVEVRLLRIKPYPEIGPITITDPMNIVEWTQTGLMAAGKTHICQWTQLSVDFVARRVQLVATPRCGATTPVVEELKTFPMVEHLRTP